MPDSDDADGDRPLDRDDQEIGAAVANESEFLLDVLPHFYRGEVSQANSARDRIDRTTDWAITLLAAVLSIVYFSRNMPAFLLLIGIFVLSIFLFFEVRRYQLQARRFRVSRLSQTRSVCKTTTTGAPASASSRRTCSRTLSSRPAPNTPPGARS